MEFLIVLGAIYLVIGAIYAIYILFLGSSKWYLFPINLIGGPLVVLYYFYKSLMERKTL